MRNWNRKLTLMPVPRGLPCAMPDTFPSFSLRENSPSMHVCARNVEKNKGDVAMATLSALSL